MPERAFQEDGDAAGRQAAPKSGPLPQPGNQLLFEKRGLPASTHSGHGGQASQRKAQLRDFKKAAFQARKGQDLLPGNLQSGRGRLARDPGRQILTPSTSHQATAARSASGAQLHPRIGGFQELPGWIGGQDGVPLLHQPAKKESQAAAFLAVQAHAGFVEEDELVPADLSQEGDELQPPGLPQGERSQGPVGGQVAEAGFHKMFDPAARRFSPAGEALPFSQRGPAPGIPGTPEKDQIGGVPQGRQSLGGTGFKLCLAGGAEIAGGDAFFPAWGFPDQFGPPPQGFRQGFPQPALPAGRPAEPIQQKKRIRRKGIGSVFQAHQPLPQARPGPSSRKQGLGRPSPRMGKEVQDFPRANPAGDVRGDLLHRGRPPTSCACGALALAAADPGGSQKTP